MSKANEKQKKTTWFRVMKNFFFLYDQNQNYEMTLKDGLRSLRYHYKNLYEWTPKLFYLGIFRFIPDIVYQ